MSQVIIDNIRRDGAHIVFDINPELCRQQITLAQSDDLYEAGSVLQADGANYVLFDGSGTAAGVLFGRRDASVANKRAVMSVRSTVINPAGLAWATGVTDTEKVTAMASLLIAHIVPSPTA